MNISYNIDQLTAVVHKQVLPLLDKYRIITLDGAVGAGKTTMTKELLRQAGVTGLVTSPTFAYVNSYQMSNSKWIHHFDLYRIDSLDGFLMNGFDEYLHDTSSVCIIEWPEVIASLLHREPLKSQTCQLMLCHDTDECAVRHLSIVV
jgi:tRNA threonylcarbamoyladenosine biosynthesis protein TsaE